MSAELLIPAMLNDASITALIGDRLALNRLPTNSTFPACVYQIISDTPTPFIDYLNGQQLTKARVQFNPLAASVGAVIQIQDAIKALMNFKHSTTYSGILLMSSRVEMLGNFEQDVESGVWTRPIDYFIQYYQ